MTTVKQLFETLQKHKRLDLLSIDYVPALEDRFVTLQPKVFIEDDDKLTYQYYFYHHLSTDFPASAVIKAIEEKDFDTFNQIYNEWYFKHNLTYLPDSIHIFNETKGEPIGLVSGIWLKDIFEFIDFAEYECG